MRAVERGSSEDRLQGMALKEQPTPKERRGLAIPDELQDSLRQVWELIEEAKRDPDINLHFDDAIQVGAVCGGRTGEECVLISLLTTRLVMSNRVPGTWRLTLWRSKILRTAACPR